MTQKVAMRASKARSRRPKASVRISGQVGVATKTSCQPARANGIMTSREITMEGRRVISERRANHTANSTAENNTTAHSSQLACNTNEKGISEVGDEVFTASPASQPARLYIALVMKRVRIDLPRWEREGMTAELVMPGRGERNGVNTTARNSSR